MMTKGRPKGTPVPKGPRRVTGVLVCDTCKRVVPYTAIDPPVPGSDPWPLHRCGLEVRPFSRFSDEDPFRPALPKREGAYPEGWL
jgi:hypothetical protein